MRIYIYLVISTILFFLIFSCSDNIVNEPNETYGVVGLVVDTAGNPIPDVKIYCLYYKNYLPENPVLFNDNFNFFEPGAFDFELKQNFPNPVYNSTFIRFSLPYAAEIRLTIKNIISGQIVYNITGNYVYGLYQLYLDEIVSNLKLENGNYIVTLVAKGISGDELIAENKLFVISDLGEPNTITKKNGFYFFDYQKAFIGDTVFITHTDDSSVFPKKLTNRIYLKFIKEGYYPTTISVDLIPNFLLRRDLLLYNE